MMVALVVYAYAIGDRSSRGIERRCREDVAFRVITVNQAPDHATIARFRVRLEQALAELFGQILGLCAQAGLVRVGIVAVDGTKVHANASERATRDYEQIAREILEQAAEIDAAEDEQFGERRGDELPPALSTTEGRQRWLRDAQRRLDQLRAQQARPIPRSRAKRLLEARRRLEEELDVQRRANAEYEAYRARGVMKDGRRFGRPPSPTARPTCRRARSTSPIWIRATSRRCVAGVSWTTLAAKYGCSTTTLRKTAYPEVRRAYNTAKSTAGENPATRRARDLQRLDAQRDRCVVCGQTRGRGSQKRGPGLCQDCINDKANSRVDMIIAMRVSMSDREIADTLEMTYAAVRQKIYLARKAGLTVPPAFRPGGAVART